MARKTRQIVLPSSGLRVTIRKPGGVDAQDFRMRLLARARAQGVNETAKIINWYDTDPDAASEALEEQIASLCRQIVEPKMTVDGSNDTMDIHDLDDDDYQALVVECDKWVEEGAAALDPTSANQTDLPPSGSQLETAAVLQT